MLNFCEHRLYQKKTIVDNEQGYETTRNSYPLKTEAENQKTTMGKTEEINSFNEEKKNKTLIVKWVKKEEFTEQKDKFGKKYKTITLKNSQNFKNINHNLVEEPSARTMKKPSEEFNKKESEPLKGKNEGIKRKYNQVSGLRLFDMEEDPHKKIVKRSQLKPKRPDANYKKHQAAFGQTAPQPRERARNTQGEFLGNSINRSDISSQKASRPIVRSYTNKAMSVEDKPETNQDEEINSIKFQCNTKDEVEEINSKGMQQTNNVKSQSSEIQVPSDDPNKHIRSSQKRKTIPSRDILLMGSEHQDVQNHWLYPEEFSKTFKCREAKGDRHCFYRSILLCLKLEQKISKKYGTLVMIGYRKTLMLLLVSLIKV